LIIVNKLNVLDIL